MRRTDIPLLFSPLLAPTAPASHASRPALPGNRSNR